MAAQTQNNNSTYDSRQLRSEPKITRSELLVVSRILCCWLTEAWRNVLRARALTRTARTDTFLSYATSILAALVPLASLLLPNTQQVGPAPASSTESQGAIDANNETQINAHHHNDNNWWLHSVKRNSGLLAASTLHAAGLQSRVEYVMGWLERSIEHLPSFPRLHPQECVKRSICEAHNEPQKHGAIGFMLRLLFPATSVRDDTDLATSTTTEYKVINKYRHAATLGSNWRLDNNATSGTTTNVCREKYEDCLVSLLDVARNLVDLFVR